MNQKNLFLCCQAVSRNHWIPTTRKPEFISSSRHWLTRRNTDLSRWRPCCPSQLRKVITQRSSGFLNSC